MNVSTLRLLQLLLEWLSTSKVITDLIEKILAGGKVTQADMDAAREKVKTAVANWDKKPD